MFHDERGEVEWRTPLGFGDGFDVDDEVAKNGAAESLAVWLKCSPPRQETTERTADTAVGQHRNNVETGQQTD